MKKILTAVALSLVTITASAQLVATGANTPEWKKPPKGFVPMGLAFMDLGEYEKELALQPDPKFTQSRQTLLETACKEGMSHVGTSINKYTMMDCVGVAESMVIKAERFKGASEGKATAYGMQVACGRGMTNGGRVQSDISMSTACGYFLFKKFLKT